MKAAISIPDKIHIAAEQAAKGLGISRSEFYTRAVRDFIEFRVSEEITEKLNQLYSAEDSSLDFCLQSMQRSSLNQEEW